MNKKSPQSLTDLQLAVMEQVWARGAATVTVVHDALFEAKGLAKKTVGTLMARLEKQGFLAHTVEGREFVYQPRITKDEVSHAKVKNAVDRLFGGSLPALVSHALESQEVSRGDVERVRELIGEWEKKTKKERK